MNKQDNLDILDKFIKSKSTTYHFLKRPDSRYHYILWWTDNGDFVNKYKSRSRFTKEENASIIVEDDIENHILYFINSGYNFYDTIKLTFSGTIRK